MSHCTCIADKEMTCIVHPTTRSLKDRIADLEAQVAAQNKEIKVVHTLMKGLTGKLAALIQESDDES